MDIAEQRQAAAERAVEEVRPGMIVGLGVGRAASLAMHAIARRLEQGTLRDILGVPCSTATAEQAAKLGIPLTTLDAHPEVDLTIDGADEVDEALNLIKGGGGALLHEKIVAQASRRELIVVEASKLSLVLGEKWDLPVEVIPFGMGAVARYLASIGGQPSPRIAQDGTLFRTDEGNHILDCHFGPMPRPEEIATQLDGRAGIVEHGLFIGLATEVFVGSAAGVRILRRSPGAVKQAR